MPVGAPSPPIVLEEGVVVKSRERINFIGATVTATDDPVNGKVDVTITGGGSGDMTKAVYDPDEDGVIAKAQLDASLANTSGTNTGDQTLAGLGGVAHSLATAINDFLVASSAGAFVKKTLAETKAILDWAADIATHAGLTTGVHGVGVGTVAKVSDIATDANLSAAGQDAISKRHTQNTDTDLDATFEATILKHTDVDDVPVDGVTDDPVSSNWAFDHVAAADPHTGYRLESADHSHQSAGAQAGKLDHGLALDGLADDDHTQYMLESNIGIADNNYLEVDDAAAADDDFARFTANGIEGISAQTALSAILAQVMLENDSLKLDPALSVDGKWNGITETGTAGTALAFGDLCYYAVADSRWELADADAEATAFGKLGICVLAAAGDGSATAMLLWGKVNAATAFPDLTVGAPVFVGTTAGDIQVAAPTGSADIIRIVGYGNTADELYFCPENDYLELV